MLGPLERCKTHALLRCVTRGPIGQQGYLRALCLQTLIKALPFCGGRSEVPQLQQTLGGGGSCAPNPSLGGCTMPPQPLRHRRRGDGAASHRLTPVLQLRTWRLSSTRASWAAGMRRWHPARRDARLGRGGEAGWHSVPPPGHGPGLSFPRGPLGLAGTPQSFAQHHPPPRRERGTSAPVVKSAVLKGLLPLTFVIIPVQSFFMFSFNYFSLSSLPLFFPPLKLHHSSPGY